MDILFTFIVWIACAFGCYKIAESNDRDVTLAAIMGFIFGSFAVIIYAIIGKRKE